jgi:hypothetical protein
MENITGNEGIYGYMDIWRKYSGNVRRSMGVLDNLK